VLSHLCNRNRGRQLPDKTKAGFQIEGAGLQSDRDCENRARDNVPQVHFCAVVVALVLVILQFIFW
jgi:hypothetical protein